MLARLTGLCFLGPLLVGIPPRTIANLKISACASLFGHIDRNGLTKPSSYADERINRELVDMPFDKGIHPRNSNAAFLSRNFL